MRVVALEEHFTVPSLVSRISDEAKAKRGFRPRTIVPGSKSPLDLLPDLGEARLKSMDAGGVTMQVISISGPAADLVDGQEGVDLARALNDALAEATRRHPDRYAGFAHLPMRAPEATARELERAVKELGFCGAIVNGTTDDKFLDDPRYDGLLATAQALDVPIYIHPSLAPEAVRNVYYSNLPGTTGTALECAGWGWHSEVAIHTLRLAFSGAFDKYPGLKIIIGHMGEGLPTMLARIDDVSAAHVRHLSRPVGQAILDQVWITTSGVFTQPPLMAALATFGLDRIMFSVDYPYSDHALGKAFLEQLPFSPADMAKFAHGTADKLLKLKAG